MQKIMDEKSSNFVQVGKAYTYKITDNGSGFVSIMVQFSFGGFGGMDHHDISNDKAMIIVDRVVFDELSVRRINQIFDELKAMLREHDVWVGTLDDRMDLRELTPEEY